ncbi:arylsulfatase [Pseudocolwellia sp. AS88]|uniref:arylsulfatase n=1 Tax=Pseudocolwellia sp. AS88 TaxID=3063958 RepID=UPI0026F2D8AE|nr:arylsulfatase [Pseudocolwellia sp. AS88]MDO7085580.1 arylsulfatase [Pseudocolwellia sp. AS88]
MRNHIKVISTGALFLLNIIGCSSEQQSGEKIVEQTRPNIIIVMTDDQGYGDFGHNNNPIVKTPVLEKLANESVRFTNFHVDPTCSPTRAALMSGQYSLRAGVWHTVMGRHILSDKHTTLPEVLKGAGYKTGMVGKWHLGDNYPFRPQDQGFDYVLMHGAGGIGQTPDHWGNTQFDDTYFLNGKEKQYKGYATDIWFDEAINFIHDNANKEKPFFLYVSTNAPHAPFRAPEKYIQPYRDLGVPEELALFYGMIASLDENVDRLQNAMKETNITDNTIFIFMTDNGSVMGGKGAKLVSGETKALIEQKIGQKIVSLNDGMKGAKNNVYEGGHRVPFYIKWPNGGFIKPTEINGLAAHFDLLPTLLDLIGVDADKLDTDGISLKSALTQNSQLPDRTLVVTTQRVLTPDPNRPYVVMKNKWRYIHGNSKADNFELFDLELDPGQTMNILEQHPEIANELSNSYQQWWDYTTSNGMPTMRSIIGSDKENPMRITSHDWLAPDTGQVAHTPGFGDDHFAHRGWLGRESSFEISPWKVTAEKAGKYRFTLYLHDKSANKIIPKSFAHISLNGKSLVKKIDTDSTHVVFESNIELGNLDIKAWFNNTEDSTDKPLAVFYLYIEKL